MNNNYFLRKKQELELLNSYLKKPLNIKTINSVEQVLNLKNHIINNMKKANNKQIK